MSSDLGTREDWTYPGARALCLLHERELRRFLAAWRRAKAAGVQPPEGLRAHVQSLDAILLHVLEAPEVYLVSACAWLGLPRPAVPLSPAAEELEERADEYLEAMLAAWSTPLRTVTEDAVDRTMGVAPWGVSYSVDALLEHAVLHPMRHTLQLEGWIAETA